MKNPMADDRYLLKSFCENRSQEAFAVLVDRYLGLVYAAGLRRVGGQRQLAEDIAQQVFIELARRAESLAGHPMLIGWLYSYTRFAALRALRGEKRRELRERTAIELNAADAGLSAPQLAALQSIIDEAVDSLSSADRSAVLLRFFDGRSFAEIGAQLHLTEDGARLRVRSALGRLGRILHRQGITSTSAGLAAALAESLSASEVPVALPAAVVKASAVASLGAKNGLGVGRALFHMSTTKAVVVATGIVAACIVAWIAGTTQLGRRNRTTIEVLQTLPRPHSPSLAHAPSAPYSGTGTPSLRMPLAAESQRSGRRESPSLTGNVLVPAAQWHNVGNQTPAAAFETFAYAREHTDAEAMLNAISLNEEAQKFIADYFKSLPTDIQNQFGSADTFAAALWAAPHHDPTVTALQVVGETPKGENLMYLTTEWQYANGLVQQKEIPFFWIHGGWRWVLNAGYLSASLRALGDQRLPIDSVSNQ